MTHPPIPPNSPRFRINDHAAQFDLFMVFLGCGPEGWIDIELIVSKKATEDCANAARCAWWDEASRLFEEMQQLSIEEHRFFTDQENESVEQAYAHANAWAAWGRERKP